MLRRSPLRRNEVNRSAGRMGPRTRMDLHRTMSPMPLPERGPSSAVPRVLPPHLVEKNQRVDFLRKLGMGRRKADQIGRRSYFTREVDELMRGLMRVPPADNVHLQQEQDAAMLKKILSVLDPSGEVALPLPSRGMPQPPSPPRINQSDINWIGSPVRPSGSSFYNTNPLLDRGPIGDYLEHPVRQAFNDVRNNNLFHRNPDISSPPYMNEPIIGVSNYGQESFSQNRDHLDMSRQMDYMYRLTNEPINQNNNELSYRSYTDDSGNSSYMADGDMMHLDAFSPNNRAQYQLNRPNIYNNEPAFNLQQSNNVPGPLNNGNGYNRTSLDGNKSHYAAPKRMHSQSNEREPETFSKRQRRRGFYIGGYRLPYLNTTLDALPQPEIKSYATKFFMRSPNFIIGVCSPESETVYNEEDISDDESLTGNMDLDEEGNPIISNVRRCMKQCVIESLCLEWIKIYRPKNYRNWHNWWKDFVWCDVGIDKQLERFRGYNLKYSFIPNVSSDGSQNSRANGGDSVSPIDKMVNKMLKSAHLALVKNQNRYYRNMRTIYQLMTESFLESLSLSGIEQLLDMIRSVPNHLWVYKMRSMVYMWSKYWELNTKDPDINNQNFLATSKEWNSPVFHWVAKQAMNELKCISKFEWGGHVEFFDKDKKV